MTRNWKPLVLLVASVLVGATAVAFASDLVSTKVSMVSQLGIMSMSQTDDSCPPDACSIVFKSGGDGSTSKIVDVH